MKHGVTHNLQYFRFTVNMFLFGILYKFGVCKIEKNYCIVYCESPARFSVVVLRRRRQRHKKFLSYFYRVHRGQLPDIWHQYGELYRVTYF